MSDRVGRDDPEWPDDETARRLREVLGQAARAVHPSGDGLTRIREKVRDRRHSRRAWLRPLAVSTAALATAAVAVIAVVVVEPHGSNSHTPSPLAGTASPTPTTPAPSASAPPSPAPAASATHPVTIYYVGKLADPQQLLYSETVLRPQPASNAFIGDAVKALLTTPANDPDYVSYWPSGATVLGVSIQDNTKAVVDLSAEAGTAAPDALGMGEISAQQLFYTVHGAAPKIDTVELRIAGKPVTSLWGTDITNPIVAEPTWQVFAHVWITYPADNATVAQAVTFGGDAIVFEGTVTWQILMNGDVLKDGHTQAAEAGPAQSPWQETVTLAPGTYTIRAFEVSAKDGSATYVDDKVITVK